jgi:hypothetical protein
MGILNRFLELLGIRRREGPPLEATPLRLFSKLFLENYAFLAGSSFDLTARDSSYEAWEAAFASETRIALLQVHEGAAAPAARLFIGAITAAALRNAYSRSRPREALPAEGSMSIRTELAAVDILAEGLGEAFSVEGSEPTLSYDLLEPGALQLYRWLLRDCRFLEFSSAAGYFFLAMDGEAYESLVSRLALPLFMEDLLGRVRPDAAAARGAGIGRIRNEELRIEGGRDFPLAAVLMPKRLALSFGEAKLRAKALLICADGAPLASRVGSGYKVVFRFAGAERAVEVPLYFLASAIGAFEPGSEEWRALLRAAASRCAANLARIFRLKVDSSGAAAVLAEAVPSRGPVSAISYDLSLGRAKGTFVLAFGSDFLALAASRLFGPKEAERLRLSSRNIFLAIESLNARIASAGFAHYSRSLSAAPAAATLIASRLPVAGRPLYAILEELKERDIAAILGKLTQKGFMRREDRYSIFLHAAAEDAAAKGDFLTAATPCEDYESLFSRFPKRWEEAEGSRTALRAAFRSLDDLLEAHYEAAWLLYRELLADRLVLSGTGEAILRASGEAFEARLRAVLEEQGRELESLVRGLAPEYRNALPWADRARELCGLSGLAKVLAPSIGERAADALGEAIAVVEARLASGREDAYDLWKARRAFAAELREKKS